MVMSQIASPDCQLLYTEIKCGSFSVQGILSEGIGNLVYSPRILMQLLEFLSRTVLRTNFGEPGTEIPDSAVEARRQEFSLDYFATQEWGFCQTSQACSFVTLSSRPRP